MNRFFVVGNLGEDAKLHVFQNGGTVLSFSVATTEKWTDKNTGEKKEKTEWHRCKKFANGPQGVAEYLKKGTKVAIEGSITYSSYEKEGVKSYATDLKVDRLELLGSKNGTGASPAAATADDDGLPADSEIPF